MKKGNYKERVRGSGTALRKEIWRHRELYAFVVPALVVLLIFAYGPMYGVVMAFQDVKLGNSIFQNDWVGLTHFRRFFSSPWFGTTVRNTVLISLLANVVCWPTPILLALLLHNTTRPRLRKIVQSVTYLPNLLSVVVVVSIITVFCSGSSGLINILLVKLGLDPVNFFGDPAWVYPMYVISGIWQTAGYQAVVYLGALASVDEELIDAAKIDGAGKVKRIWHVQLPAILPTVVTMLILNMGRVFAMGADKMLLLQTDLNLERSEVLATYVYKVGFNGIQYGFSAAIGILQNGVNLICLLFANWVCKKLTDISLV